MIGKTVQLPVATTDFAPDRRRGSGALLRVASWLFAALLMPCSAAIAATGTPLYGWQNVTVSAPFAWRDGAGALVYANKMWLIGGWNSETYVFPATTTNEVWSSVDGVKWKLVKPNTFGTAAFAPASDWEGRHMAGWAVFNDRMWIIGGDSNQCHYQNDVWNSSDGARWSKVTANVPWGNRVLFYTVVFNGMLWVMGGQTLTLANCAGYPQQETYYNDIWNSPDGANWTRVQVYGQQWSPRGVICGSVVFNGRMWILGGGTYGSPQSLYDDVWNSGDGVHWTEVTAKAPWSPRVYHDVAVFGGRMWVFGGAADSSGNLSDSWSSPDGKQWTKVALTPWLARHAASVFVYKNAVWLTGGSTDDNGPQNDVWKLDLGPIVPLIDSLFLLN